MKPEEFQDCLKNLEKEFKELYTRVAPRAAGRVAVRLFKENFRDQGFFGKRWKEVQRRRGVKGRSGKAGSRRKILTGATGDLRRSIRYTIDERGTATIFTDASRFAHSKKPYGKVHNEGGVQYVRPHHRKLRTTGTRYQVRGYSYKMPKRQFIGDHKVLRKAVAEEIVKKIKEIEIKQTK